MSGLSVEERARAACGSVAPPEGAAVLRDVHNFIGRFVAYPSDRAHVAHTLWIAHTHLMPVWQTTPRIAFLSTEPGSGKSRALEVTEPLVPDPVHAVSATPAYLFRKIGQHEDTLPTVLFDEIDAIFGPKAAGNEELRALLNSGYRRGAVAGRCVVRGKEVFTEELPSYCPVALAGLGSLPDTILTRSVIIRMRRRAPSERVEPFRERTRLEGEPIRQRLARWAASVSDSITWPELPPEIQDRDADVWEPIIAVADAAGGEWPDLARVAAVALVADFREDGGASLGVRLLHDLRTIFGSDVQLSTAEIIKRLHSLEDSPWSDLKGKPLDARGLSYRLRQYEVKPKNLRDGFSVVKGYDRYDLNDAWIRYLRPMPEKCATGATSATSAADKGFSVADAASVAASTPVCASSAPIEPAQTGADSDADFAERIMARFEREAVR